MSRRRVLALLGGGTGVVVLGGYATYQVSESAAPGVRFVEKSIDGTGVSSKGKPGETAMSESGASASSAAGAPAGGKVLVVYASRAGSTGEVAEAIAEELGKAGASVDSRRVQDVRDLGAYRAVILGSAARMGKLLPEALSFVKLHQSELRDRPVAYFMAGTTMIEDTPEHRQTALGYLQPLREVKAPVGEPGLFAGKVDHTKLSFPWNFMLSFVKEGAMTDADHRNWDAIRGWAKGVAPAVLG
jgi:menaquinone-dependent protoporphyrinogen oxidase